MNQLMILMIALAQWKNNISINFSKPSTKFSLSLHYSGDDVHISYVHKRKICKFAAKE